MAHSADVIVATLPGGRRVDASVRGHVIHTDQPLDNGGDDTAPSPFELFLGSLATCAGIFVQGFCATRGLDSRDIRVLVRPSYGEDGGLAKVALELELPSGFPAKYEGALVRVVDQCSVKRAILAQPSFSVAARRAALPPDAGPP